MAGNYKHGYFGTPTYKSWAEMKYRCGRKEGYKNISYCKRWDKFENFLQDMGERPPNCSLDRINVNGNYEPLNCRWANNHVQAINKTNSRYLTFKGETRHISEWAVLTGIKRTTISARILDYGWSVEKSLTVGGNYERKTYV